MNNIIIFKLKYFFWITIKIWLINKKNHNFINTDLEVYKKNYYSTSIVDISNLMIVNLKKNNDTNC